MTKDILSVKFVGKTPLSRLLEVGEEVGFLIQGITSHYNSASNSFIVKVFKSTNVSSKMTEQDPDYVRERQMLEEKPEDEGSENFPLGGGTLEKYDIEKEREMTSK